MQKQKRIKKAHLILLIITLVLLAGLTFFALEKTGVINVFDQSEDNSINYGPPTSEEQAAGNEQKELIADEEEKQKQSQPPTQGEDAETSQTPKKNATVIITDAGQYDGVIEVRSFIPDHYEDGSCTIAFTQGTLSVSKQTPAYKDATTTICTNPLFNRSEFPAGGVWSVVVSYSSSSAEGSSDPQGVTLQ